MIYNHYKKKLVHCVYCECFCTDTFVSELIPSNERMFDEANNKNLNINVVGIVESPLKGPKGNTEFLIYCENYKNLKQ